MPARILISGAGIAGTTLAWHLSKAGMRVTIVEKSPSLLPHGQNVDITGSAITVVRKMGLVSQIRRHNTTEKGGQFIDPKGRPFAPFPVKEGLSASFTSEFEILRGDLAKILYNATNGHPNVEYRFSTTINKVISNEDAAVKVELSDGKIHDYALVVAADGQWSKLRKQCFPPDSVDVIDKGMFAAYFTIPRLPHDNDWWNVYVGVPSQTISVRPDPHGTIRALFTTMPRTPAQREAWAAASKSGRRAQEQILRAEFADAGWQAPRLLDAMAQAPDFYFHAIQQIRMAAWSRSRVVCLGDAAFAPTPLTGMGTSLAITGAYVLAGELSRLRLGRGGDGHPAEALEAYERTFRPFVEEMQQIPFFVPGIAHPKTAWKRWFLHTFARGLSRVAATVVATPWLAQRFGQDNEDDFSLPRYLAFDDECSKPDIQ